MAYEQDRGSIQLPFQIARKGYDRDEVRNYFERFDAELRVTAADRDAAAAQARDLAKQLDDARDDIDDLRKDVDRLSVPPTTAEGMSDRISRMLRLASDEASEVRAKAEADAVQEIRNGFADPKTGAERAQWYLERAHNDRWGRREKVTVENAVNAEVDLILARLEAALPPEWFEVALRAITGGGAGRGEAGDADGVPRLPDATDPVH